MKHYESLRTHFLAGADYYQPCLPRTLALLMNKGLAAWIKVLNCQSFEHSKQSYQPDTSERTEGFSGLQAEVVRLLSNMIEHQINPYTK